MTVQPTSRIIREKIHEEAEAGVRDTKEMKQLLERYVANEVFMGKPAPPRHDSRYYPSTKTMYNHMAKAKQQ